MADFLAAHPASDDTHLSDDLPDEEVLYAKVQFPWGSMVHPGAGAGIVFMTPERSMIPYSFTLTSAASNKAAE